MLKDARTSIQESLSKWLPSYTEVLESRPSTSKGKFDPVEVCPLLYTTRIATAKILIELEDWDNATKVNYLILPLLYFISSCIKNDQIIWNSLYTCC